MNTADRSLAVVDYALRRRFAFVTAEPAFGQTAFKEYLRRVGVASELVEQICNKMGDLNATIADDRTNLGPGFRIGHSFFLPRESDKSEVLDEEWYARVIDTEIMPLLEEYWFDDPDQIEIWRQRLGDCEGVRRRRPRGIFSSSTFSLYPRSTPRCSS